MRRLVSLLPRGFRHRPKDNRKTAQTGKRRADLNSNLIFGARMGELHKVLFLGFFFVFYLSKGSRLFAFEQRVESVNEPSACTQHYHFKYSVYTVRRQHNNPKLGIFLFVKTNCLPGAKKFEPRSFTVCSDARLKEEKPQKQRLLMYAFYNTRLCKHTLWHQ